MKRVLVLIKSKDKLRFVGTASDSLKKYLEKDGIEVTRDYLGHVNYYFDVQNKVWKGNIRDRSLAEFDVIYLQTAGTLRDQATLLANYCRDNKINLIEGNYLKTCSNSKLIQALRCYQGDITFPRTIYMGDWQREIKEIGYPVVAKNLLGKGGEGVSLIHNVSELRQLQKEENLEGYIFQEYIENEFDWRLVVVDGRVIYGCKRIRQNKDDFRNNVKLGAMEELGIPSAELKSIAKKAAKAMNLTVAGVDIIENQGRKYVIEINRSPSLPVNYDVFKGIPAVGEYIKRCLK